MAKGRKRIADERKIIQGTFQKCRSSQSKEKQSASELRMVEFVSEEPSYYFDLIKSALSELSLDSDSYSILVSAVACRCVDFARAQKSGHSTVSAGAFSDILRSVSLLSLTPSDIHKAKQKKETEQPKGFGVL